MRKSTAVLALLLSGIAAPALAQTTVIHAGSVITDADSAPRGPATITVTDGRIVSIADGFTAAPAGAETVELRDSTVLPGLIDLHVHLTGDPGGDFWKETVEPDEWGVVVGAKNAEKTLRAGFTTVREAGSSQHGAFSLRRGTEEGLITGPRIIAAGPSLAIVGGHGDVTGFRPEINAILSSGYTCTGAVECAEKVRRASQNGADTIKITAARAGIDTIEHGTYLDRAAAEAMVANGTVLIPTLMAFQGISERLGKGIYTPVVEEKVRAVAETARVFMGRAREWGVPIAFGTDAGVFDHGRNAGEFALMVGQGMSDREALASATTVAARVLDMENEIGRIAPGYSADIIAVSGNPLENVRVLENVDWVMVRGRVAD
ncbi:MAG: amidohydrolase family protein [Citromicrobium sp.]|nr:MAG: amidohydrolase family protein [Citromicrobium sp.]